MPEEIPEQNILSEGQKDENPVEEVSADVIDHDDGAIASIVENSSHTDINNPDESSVSGDSILDDQSVVEQSNSDHTDIS